MPKRVDTLADYAFKYSDDARTWTEPAFMRYEPGGTPVNHPNAANLVRRLREGRRMGKYFYGFHHNEAPWYNHAIGAGSRNLVRLLGGIERDSPQGKVILWECPQVVLHCLDALLGISYPDFIDDGEDLYISETQKTTARVHQVERSFIDSLFASPDSERSS